MAGNAVLKTAEHYVGSELEVFEHAVTWKAYFRRQIAAYLRGDILEVGAGIGATTAALRGPGQHRWSCLEPDGDLAKQAADRLKGDAGVEVLHGTLADLPDGRRYDAVLYLDVLEHIEGDREELARAARRLNAGGHLIVLSPAHQFLFSPFDKAVGHVRRYSLDGLRGVGPEDLRAVRFRYLDSVGMVLSFGNRALLKASSPSLAQIRFWDTRIVPLSRVLDPLLGYRVGKSVLGIWQKPA